eukprot:scaffold311222_cov36-Prasinocladus_malaysianus.AAC.1
MPWSLFWNVHTDELVKELEGKIVHRNSETSGRKSELALGKAADATRHYSFWRTLSSSLTWQ